MLKIKQLLIASALEANNLNTRVSVVIKSSTGLLLFIYSSKKVLHHLYYIFVFPKILQTSRKITKVY